MSDWPAGGVGLRRRGIIAPGRTARCRPGSRLRREIVRDTVGEVLQYVVGEGDRQLLHRIRSERGERIQRRLVQQLDVVVGVAELPGSAAAVDVVCGREIHVARVVVVDVVDVDQPGGAEVHGDVDLTEDRAIGVDDQLGRLV